MCRFLIARSPDPLPVRKLLCLFAEMCRRSRTPDGDLQADGWGLAWNRNGGWETRKSLLPIWKDLPSFSPPADVNFFLVHARSAGFPQQKGILAYNQPFVEGQYAFVFNGMIRGVRIEKPLPGKIGAQKIFRLIREEMKEKGAESVLIQLRQTLRQRARNLEAANIGLAGPEGIYVLCDYSLHPEYFSLRISQTEGITLICSEELKGFTWQSMEPGQVLAYSFE